MSSPTTHSALYRLRRWLRRRVTPEAHARDLNDELRFHLEMEIEHNMRTGLSPDAARAKARREMGAHGEFGNARPTAAAFVESFARDVRLAARTLRRAPAFTAVAVLTIALGIGVTTAVYSTIDGVLLRPLPYPAPDRIVRVYERSATNDRNAFAGENARDVERTTRTLADVAVVSAYETPVLGGTEPVATRVAVASRHFLDVFRVAPARGRAFAGSEGTIGGPRAAIVSDRFWRESLGGDVDLARHTLRVGGDDYPVVGVMPASFNYPVRVDAWLSLTDDTPSRTAHNWSLVARLAPGKSLDDARAEIDALMRRLKAQYGKETNAEGAAVVRLHDDLAQSSRTMLLVLLGAVGFVLLVACVNLASANLARGETRHREYAVRAALGAGRRRIVRQVLTENVLLSVAGGALGAALAWALTRALVTLGEASLPRYATVDVNGRVLAFAALVSVLAGLLVGAAPALQVSRDLRGAIGSARGGIEGARLRTRGVLIATEVAMAVALLAGAGLLVKSLRTLLAQDPGFRTEGALTAEVWSPSAGWGDTVRIASFYDRVLPAVRAVPGVREVGLINAIPISRNGGNSAFAVDGGSEFVGGTDYRVVDSAYFGVMGIPMVTGRTFTAADAPRSEHVAVINRTMARKYWPGVSPLGHRIRFPGMDAHKTLWLTIVGVVGDVRSQGLDEPADPAAFVYYRQRPERLGDEAALVLRARALTPGLAATIRDRVRAIDPNVSVRVATLASVVLGSVSTRTFSATVIATFAALALLLAAVGIHGVLAYVVAQRQREIGVRMALGATRGAVGGMIVGDAMRAVLPGVAVGLAGAFALTRLIQGMLYGVGAADPATYAAVTALLVAVALIAAWLPARRASKVDPLAAMRAE